MDISVHSQVAYIIFSYNIKFMKLKPTTQLYTEINKLFARQFMQPNGPQTTMETNANHHNPSFMRKNKSGYTQLASITILYYGLF